MPAGIDEPVDIERLFDAGSTVVKRRYEIENLRRSIAMLTPGARDVLNREQALDLLRELQALQSRLDDLKVRLRELADQE